jgi:hypothetical protein
MHAGRYLFEEQSSMKGAALLGRKHLLGKTETSL